MTTLPTPEAIGARLEALLAGRGFVLPHHGAMAAALPDLHAAYDTMYAALTVTGHHLTPFEREFVWLCILVAGREPVGTHHVEAFSRTGGTMEQARVALQLTGYAGAADTLGFVDSTGRNTSRTLAPRRLTRTAYAAWPVMCCPRRHATSRWRRCTRCSAASRVLPPPSGPCTRKSRRRRTSSWSPWRW